MFHQALALKPRNVRSRNALALAYLRQGRVQQGIAETILHLTRIGFSRLEVTGSVLALEHLNQAAPGSDHARAGSFLLLNRERLPATSPELATVLFNS